MTPATDRFIDIKEIQRLVGFSQAWVYEMVRDGTFPPPIKFGRASRWSFNAVQEWMAQKVREAA